MVRVERFGTLFLSYFKGRSESIGENIEPFIFLKKIPSGEPSLIVHESISDEFIRKLTPAFGSPEKGWIALNDFILAER